MIVVDRTAIQQRINEALEQCHPNELLLTEIRNAGIELTTKANGSMLKWAQGHALLGAVAALEHDHKQFFNEYGMI